MSRRTTVAALFVAALAASPICGAANPRGLSVSDDRTTVSTQIGHTFVFRSTTANGGATAARGLIAHLNVLSLRSGVYVDPEDWSSNRVRYLRPIPSSGSTTVVWKIQAVNAGTFGVYVTVLPASGADHPPVAGPTLRVSVAQRQTLNSGGILPLALGIPALLGALALGLRLSRAGRAAGE